MTDKIKVTPSVSLTPTELLRKQVFDSAVKYLRKQFTDEVLYRKWVASKLGEEVKLDTVVRWLSTSPTKTKNSRFEPFIIGLASVYR